MALNSDQKRFLAAALMELEEHLLQFEEWLQSDETATIFRKVENTFSPEQRTRLLELIELVKRQLRKMRDTFDLPTEVVDLRWHLTVTLLHIATSLEECQSRRIKGFGELDSETEKVLDSCLQDLVKLISGISSQKLDGVNNVG